MSLQRSYSQNNHVTAATDVLSRRSPRSPDPRSGAEAMMFSLVHLDVSLAIEPPAPDMRTSVLGEPSFRVSAKPLARAAICSDRGTAGEEITDPVMQRLSDALAATRAMHHPDYAILLDALRLAMLTRKASWGTVVSRPRDTRAPGDREGQAARRVRSLQKWRLKRVLEHIEDNLDAKVTLQHLAAVAGLSRMYFAAQFRGRGHEAARLLPEAADRPSEGVDAAGRRVAHRHRLGRGVSDPGSLHDGIQALYRRNAISMEKRSSPTSLSAAAGRWEAVMSNPDIHSLLPHIVGIKPAVAHDEILGLLEIVRGLGASYRFASAEPGAGGFHGRVTLRFCRLMAASIPHCLAKQCLVARVPVPSATVSISAPSFVRVSVFEHQRVSKQILCVTERSAA
ncbi:hypothetical protein [Bradyrhizobium vignae]|uniref:hypothetical protein n=1 Tax=Bradyrhizobium vignae TaxID=1549949 RepID=UPI004062E98B